MAKKKAKSLKRIRREIRKQTDDFMQEIKGFPLLKRLRMAFRIVFKRI